MMDYITTFFASFLIVGLMYFILYNAISTVNYKRKALGFFIFGFIIFLGTLAGFIYDLKRDSYMDIKYFIFPSMNLLFMLAFEIIFLVSGNKYHHSFTNFKNANEGKVSQYLYVLIRWEDQYLLVKEMVKEKKEVLRAKYKGIKVKFEKNIIFHDEMITKFIEDYNLKTSSVKLAGKVKVNGKKTQEIYCYNLVVFEKSFKNLILSPIDKYEILKCYMDEEDKKIILNMLVNKDFEITV